MEVKPDPSLGAGWTSILLGMILVGNVLPMFLLLTGSGFGFALAGVLILTGLYIGERIWVKAPQLVPLS